MWWLPSYETKSAAIGECKSLGPQMRSEPSAKISIGRWKEEEEEEETPVTKFHEYYFFPNPKSDASFRQASGLARIVSTCCGTTDHAVIAALRLSLPPASNPSPQLVPLLEREYSAMVASYVAQRKATNHRVPQHEFICNDMFAGKRKG